MPKRWLHCRIREKKTQKVRGSPEPLFFYHKEEAQDEGTVFEPDEGIIEIDGKNPATDIGTAKRIVYVAGVMSYSEMKLKKIIEEYRLMYEKFDEEFAYKLMELFGLNKKAKNKKRGAFFWGHLFSWGKYMVNISLEQCFF